MFAAGRMTAMAAARRMHSAAVASARSVRTRPTAGGSAHVAPPPPPPPVAPRLVFSSDRTRFFRLMTVAALSQAAFLTVAATIAPEMREEEGPTGTAEGDERPPKASLTKRIGASVIAVGLAGSFVYLAILVPRRYVTRLSLSDAKTVAMETYTIFGRRQLEAPVRAIKFQMAKPDAILNSTVMFKLDGHRHYFMLDGGVGRVHDHSTYKDILKNASRI